ncbi:receptor-type tyrosine-protein phosphatase eta [Megalops cyprinoides]|uniref:receptor-type tyrosine-protein phosphatase eta n=1 Tax=Megalops cyprinoides TaxID=118141 RepID=UPI00186437CA|nr:receptor-type tyrosine-protein phosphatase eta [Megalops cyprinoides]
MRRLQSLQSVLPQALLVLYLFFKASHEDSHCSCTYKIQTISTVAVQFAPVPFINCSSDNFTMEAKNDNITIHNLTPGQSYIFNISCVVPNGASPVVCCLNFTTVPNTISNLTVTNVTSSSVSLSWTKPQGEVSGYLVTWNDGFVIKNTTANGTSLLITNLAAATQYIFSVTAIAEDGITGGDPIKKSQYTRPDVIRSLTVTNVTTSAVSLSWTEPQRNSSFYRVNWTDGSITKSDTTNETSFIVTGLTAGTRYEFRVTAVAADRLTEGDSVNNSQHTRPDVIRSLTVTNVTTSAVSLSWTEPQGNSSFYRVNWTDSSITKSDTTNETSFTVTGLTAGTRYEFRVTAVAADRLTEGDSVNKYQFTRPDVIRDLIVTNVTTSAVSLRWTKPQGNSSFYRVNWTDSSITKTSTTNEPSFAITNLTAGTQYVFSVTAVAVDSVTQGDSVIKSQNTRPEKVGNIKLLYQENSTLGVSWSLLQGNISFYSVRLIESNFKQDFTYNQTTIGANFTGLYPGRLYNLTVISVFGSLQNAADTLQFATKPNPPRLNKTARTNQSISITWDYPFSMDGVTGISYIIYWLNQTEWNTVSTLQNSTTISSLASGTKYSISVETVGPQKLRSIKVNLTEYTIPNPVINLKASCLSVNSVRLEWTSPIGAQSTYTYRALISGPSDLEKNYTSQTNNITIGDLAAGTRYNFTVTTVISNDISSPSEFTFCYTKPETVNGLTAEAVNKTAINITWNRQDDYKDTYSYQVSISQAGSLIQGKNTSSQSIIISSLSPGSNYTCSVTTVVNDVQSDPATTSVFTKPGGAANIKTVGNTTSMTVTWDSPTGNVTSYNINIYNNGQLKDNRTGVSNRIVVFSNLRPGQIYTVNVVTISGPFQEGSETVVNATFPNPPGKIQVQNQTANSIDVSWIRPTDMDLSQYNFTVYVSGRQLMTTENWIYVDNLTSGTIYNISVATVGPMGYLSTPVSISSSTRPYSVSQLRDAGITTSNISLVWDQPEPQESYKYIAIVEYPNNNRTQFITQNTSAIIQNLQSGSGYNFTVMTLAASNTTAAAVTITLFTRPYGIGTLQADTLNTTAVFLNWTKPQEYQNGYTYRVEVSGCTDAPENQMVKTEMAYVTDLRPGTNCSFTIYSQAENGIEGQPVQTSKYTKPEKVNPTVSNGGTNNSITVTWDSPVGNVEKYVVALTGGNENTSKELNSSARTCVFPNLMAGRIYTVTLTTYSGPFTQQSDSISNATYPNPPGDIRIKDQTVRSISLEWVGATGMPTGTFNYTVTYQSTISDSKFWVTSSNTAFLPDLVSGTPYNISVSTVGPMKFTSAPVWKLLVTTRPESVQSLTVDSTSVEEIHLKWEKPVDYKPGYCYRVVIMNNTNNITDVTKDEYYQVKNLIPGSHYNFTVITLASDKTEGTQVAISNCTDAAPVSDLRCQGPNRTEAVLTLSWGSPWGSNEGFEIETEVVSEKNIPTCSGSCVHNITNLSYNTEYNVSIRTKGCGRSSSVTVVACKTGITDPPVPNTKTHVSITEQEYNKFTLEISPSLFNDTSGPIINYGILVTSNVNSLPGEKKSLPQYLNKTYEDWQAGNTVVYLAVVRSAEVISRNAGNGPVVVIGDGTTWNAYNNGPLKTSGSYSFAVVTFTHLELANDLVSISKSFFAISPFYPGEIQLPINPAVIGGAVGGSLTALLLILIFTVVAAVCWKRRSKEEEEVPIHSIRAKVSVPIRVEDYESYFRKQRADSNCGFAEQFEDLKPVGVTQAKVSALAPENKAKNRYNNVLPYDYSRVKLSVHGSPYDDYINASYMPGYNSKKEFIAAQGPLPCTVNEFWRMIWEKNVHTLVMLTRCNEQGRVKCEEYWPSGTKHFNNITVTMTSEIPLEDWTIRDFSVKNVKTAETRSLRHFHFTAWPDHGVPETTELLINFRHLVREHMDQYSRNSPAVVHCSAGVGRTGTFIAIDRLIFQIERDGVVDVYGVIHDLRMHRPLMVQTEDQYVFLNQCAMDIIRSRTGTNVDLIYQNTAALSIYENFEPMKKSKNGYHNA